MTSQTRSDSPGPLTNPLDSAAPCVNTNSLTQHVSRCQANGVNDVALSSLSSFIRPTFCGAMVNDGAHATAYDVFHEADSGGNLEIEYDEFVAALPKHVQRSQAEPTLRQWFNLADRSQSGKLTMAQFVEWSATMAELVTGVDILAGLDESRFTKVAIAMGFGD